jgi:site-specific DNA-methyltransferase (adenine-specific)
MRLELGNNIDVLKTLPDNSVDSIVTDPPYGLSFMNKKWDYDVPSTELWVECLRVLKPGGHLLSFSGSRTYHRMVVRIEDAGFEIRDQIMWVYGSGFPKSHNIGKAVDKLLGNEREVVGKKPINSILKVNRNEGWDRPWMHDEEAIEKSTQITKGNTEWEGWGTALKPAHEPIVLARKPLSEKSVAENVLRWGTGGINIDDSRIAPNENDNYNTLIGGVVENKESGIFKNEDGDSATGHKNKIIVKSDIGRFPANIIFDEEAGQVLDQQSGISTGKVGMTQQSSPNNIYNGFKSTGDTKVNDGKTDKGGASRFFYCPKASKKDRNEGLDGFEKKQVFQKNTSTFITDPRHPDGGYDHNPISQSNHHPTVKPTALMEYLIKLITPVNGIVMDPFMGSGSTGKAAARNGFDFIGIEMDEEYIKIAKARINYGS